eukprot:3059964-Rhodomonas_salina.1
MKKAAATTPRKSTQTAPMMKARVLVARQLVPHDPQLHLLPAHHRGPRLLPPRRHVLARAVPPALDARACELPEPRRDRDARARDRVARVRDLELALDVVDALVEVLDPLLHHLLRLVQVQPQLRHLALRNQALGQQRRQLRAQPRVQRVHPHEAHRPYQPLLLSVLPHQRDPHHRPLPRRRRTRAPRPVPRRPEVLPGFHRPLDAHGNLAEEAAPVAEFLLLCGRDGVALPLGVVVGHHHVHRALARRVVRLQFPVDELDDRPVCKPHVALLAVEEIRLISLGIFAPDRVDGFRDRVDTERVPVIV